MSDFGVVIPPDKGDANYEGGAAFAGTPLPEKQCVILEAHLSHEWVYLDGEAYWCDGAADDGGVVTPDKNAEEWRLRRLRGTDTGGLVAALSRWIDEHPPNAARGRTEALCLRVGKVQAEAGEVWDALSAVVGENPRKGVHGTEHELLEELLDVAITALGAWEHITGNNGWCVTALADKVARVAARAGVTSGPHDPQVTHHANGWAWTCDICCWTGVELVSEDTARREHTRTAARLAEETQRRNT